MSRLVHLALTGLCCLAVSTSVQAAATLTLSRPAGPPTTPVTVTLKGFSPGKLVDVYFDTRARCVVVPAANGSGTCSFAVPATAQPRTHWITAAVRVTGSAVQRAFVVRTDWPNAHGLTVANDGFNRYENTITAKNAHLLEPAWAAVPSELVNTSPIVVGGRVYVASQAGKLHAVDAATGAAVTGFPKTLSTASGGFYSSPTIAGGIVYQATYELDGTSKIRAYNTSTGAAVTGFPKSLAGYAYGNPIVVGGKLYIGASDGKIYGFNASTGATLANFPITVPGSPRIISSPAYFQGFLYIGADDGTLYGYDATTGVLVITRPTTGSFESASPAISGGALYYASSVEHKLYQVSPQDGNPWWTAPFTMDASWDGTPTIAYGKVYVTDIASKLYAIDTTDGTLAWSKAFVPLSNAAATVAGGVVFTGTEKRVFAFDASTGALLWSYGVGIGPNQSVTVANGFLYVGVSGNNPFRRGLVAFALKGAAERKASARPSVADLVPDRTLTPQ